MLDSQFLIYKGQYDSDIYDFYYDEKNNTYKITAFERSDDVKQKGNLTLSDNVLVTLLQKG